MARHSETDRFASRLRALRERTDYSYEALAQKTGVSRSSLHRYCMGSSVPQDYGAAHRIATVCGATPAELRELHRLWALADTEREETHGTPPSPPEGDGEAAEAPVPHPSTQHPSTPHAPVPHPRAPRAARQPPLRGGGGRRVAATAVITAAVLGGAAWGVAGMRAHTEAPAGAVGAGQDRRLLFSTGCEPVVSMGQQDTCVREVQRQLERHGAGIGVDSSFGPETLRRVTAFQVLAGLTPNGVVADPTKRALYESRVRMDTWSPKKVRERIRQVFTEVPDDAVVVADCQSFLDPLHVLPNTNGTRNWGLFQISDLRLRELGGTPYKALDPEWNIQAAKRLWSQERDFRDWPNCARSLRPSPSGAQSPPASSGAR